MFAVGIECQAPPHTHWGVRIMSACMQNPADALRPKPLQHPDASLTAAGVDASINTNQLHPTDFKVKPFMIGRSQGSIHAGCGVCAARAHQGVAAEDVDPGEAREGHHAKHAQQVERRSIEVQEEVLLVHAARQKGGTHGDQGARHIPDAVSTKLSSG